MRGVCFHGSIDRVRVAVLVDVDAAIGAKVDGIGTGRERAVVEVRVLHLNCQCFPPAGRAAVHESRPARADRAVLAFQVRNQLLLNCIRIRAEVLGVHGVGIVVVRIRVLNLDREHARKSRAGPILVELVGELLLQPVVT